jgi:acetaldehyde dehydrogenase (acetylating)
MAEAPTPSSTPNRDRDLASIQDARALARLARAAQAELAELSQERIDAIVDAMAAAVRPHAEELARLAVEETGYGNVPDKVQKNLFAAVRVHESIRPLRTVGVVGRDESRRLVEIAEPFGVVAAIIPSTNPTSTAIYKALIALKARCAIVLSPHPAATDCITRTAELLRQGALAAGAPTNAIGWMTSVTLEGTQELMKVREVAVILATGGLGLVRAAYSAGKPAYGVGPGNAPAFIERTADVPKAVADVVTGKTFDYGVLCSSENSVVVDAPVVDAVRAQFLAQGGHFLSPPEIEAVGKALVTPQRLPNPALVGKPATYIAERAGITVPPGTRVLIAPLQGVGRDHPLSIEKLCPVLSYYEVRDWREGCERCKQILRYGGMGHTMAIHSRDEAVILEFGLHKPAFRIVVNTPTSHGSIGLTTGLDPALTLGCGGFGGNITSDNIAPRHLLNIKRLAYELRPAPRSTAMTAAPAATSAAAAGPAAPLPDLVQRFLAERGIAPPTPGPRLSGQAPGPAPPAGTTGATPGSREGASAGAASASLASTAPPADFVCEDDVREALRSGRTIQLAPRAIVTPAARDLGETRGVFVRAPDDERSR